MIAERKPLTIREVAVIWEEFGSGGKIGESKIPAIVIVIEAATIFISLWIRLSYKSNDGRVVSFGAIRLLRKVERQTSRHQQLCPIIGAQSPIKSF